MKSVMMMTLLLFSLCLCFVSGISPILNKPGSNLPKGVSVINSVNASFPSNQDLSSFDSLARRAEVFGIGESAHGVAGYQNFQFRLTKYLITRHGYRRVLTEMLSDDRDLNTYVTTGQGDLQRILYYNPWQNSDVEIFNFFDWIRQYNALHPHDMVTIHTVDPQQPWLDIPFIKEFLAAYDAKYNQTFSNTLYPTIRNQCFGATFNNQIEWAFSSETDEYYGCGCLPTEKTADCVSSVGYLEDLIQAEEKSLTKSLGYTFVQDVVYALRSIRSWQTKSSTLFSDPKQSARYREVAFGLNVLWKAKRDNPRKKGSVLIAHNLHLSKDTLLAPFINTNDQDFFNNIHPVGEVLRENLGNKYVAVAQSGFNVSHMFGAAPYPFPSSPLSIDVTLNALNQNYLLLDTSASWVKAQGTWLVHEEGMPNGRYYPLKNSFDKLVFHKIAPKAVFVSVPTTSSSSKRSSIEEETRNTRLW